MTSIPVNNPVVFFEGFNYSNSDVKRLESSYWSASNNFNITFGNGRTGNGVYLAPSPYASGTSYNTRLDLSNFTSPLTNNNAFGLGLYVSTLTGDGINTPVSAGVENFITMYNGNAEVLKIATGNTSFDPGQTNDSLGIKIYQNNTLAGTFDFKSVIGRTYNLNHSNRWVNNYLDIFNWVDNIYLEFYIDPKNTNSIRVRINGMDMVTSSSSTNIAISGFTDITKISFYGTNDSYGNRMYDDLYLTKGSNIDNTLLGTNTKIYRILPESNSATMEWQNTWSDSNPWYGAGYNAPGDVSSNDGDNSYLHTGTTDAVALFNLQNLPNSAPSGVGGVRVLNTARKGMQDGVFTNVYASGDGEIISEIGPQFNLTSTIYNSYNHFMLANPQTNANWTIQDINNMQLGVKKL